MNVTETVRTMYEGNRVVGGVLEALESGAFVPGASARHALEREGRRHACGKALSAPSQWLDVLWSRVENG